MGSYNVIFSPEAEAQLLATYRWIAERATPSAAERFTGAIVDYCENLRSFPERGTCRDDLRPGLRTIGFRRRVTIAFCRRSRSRDDRRRFLRRTGFRSFAVDRRRMKGESSRSAFSHPARLP